MGRGVLVKKLAGYHQFHAVHVALEETLRAALAGDRRVGVVWHTQGSGKSLTMAFYAGRVILHPKMENPTIVVLTDRNDLDDQLFGTFARCRELLRQPPVQAENRADLRLKLSVASGGVVFTTIQKFLPEEKGDRHPVLSERRNIVLIADEAHRSQYDFIDGFARHMRDALPHASFIGFTGTQCFRRHGQSWNNLARASFSPALSGRARKIATSRVYRSFHSRPLPERSAILKLWRMKTGSGSRSKAGTDSVAECLWRRLWADRWSLRFLTVRTVSFHLPWKDLARAAQSWFS
jgi:hypothetical protein